MPETRRRRRRLAGLLLAGAWLAAAALLAGAHLSSDAFEGRDIAQNHYMGQCSGLERVRTGRTLF